MAVEVYVCQGGPYKQEHALYRLIYKEMCFVTACHRYQNADKSARGLSVLYQQWERFLMIEEGSNSEGVRET